MIELETLEDADAQVKQDRIVLLYFSLPDCGVCEAVRPKVEQMLADRPRIAAYEIGIGRLPAAAGRFEVFVAPTLLLFIEGKETIREARYFSMELLVEQIDRYLELFGST